MQKQPGSRTCFCCGRENPASLRMTWYNDVEAGKVRCTVIVPEQYNGYPGVVHGGILATILDETSGRAVMLDGDFERLMVTLNLQMTYRRPTPTGVPLTVIGWLIRMSDTRARVAGEIRLPDGTVTAECEAVVVKPPQEIADAWAEELPYWKIYDD